MHLLVGQIEQCVHTRPRQYPETIDLSANHHHFRHALAELFKGPPGKSVVRDGLRTRSLRFGPFGIQTSMRGLKRRAVPGWDDLHARAKAMATSMGLDLCRHVKRMEHHHRGEPVSGYPSSGKLAVEQYI